MKYFRWQGVTAFFVITIFIATLFYLFADIIAKKGIEKGVSLYTGAEVNVADVDINFVPLTIEVKGFQATDAEQPSTNLVSFSSAKADLHVWQYLFGKVIVDELKIDELVFASERTSVGDVYEKISDAGDESVSQEGNKLADIKQNLPDIKTLLNDSDLLTIQAGKSLQQTYQLESANLKGLKQQLPSKERLAQYQEELAELSKTKIKSLDDIQQLKEKYQVLKAKFEQDKQAVKLAKAQFNKSKDKIVEDITTLKNAPSQDWQNVAQKYQLDSLEGGDFAHMLFGQKAREYFDIAANIYERLSPLLANQQTPEQTEKVKTQGRFISFDEQESLPDIWIKALHFSLKTDAGDLVFSGSDFTYQHWLLNKNTVYQLTSNNLNQQGKVQLEGSLSLSRENIISADGKWLLQQFPIDNAVLNESEILSLTLASALLSGQGSYQLADVELTSDNNFTIEQTKYAGKGTNKVMQFVVDTLKGSDDLSLGIDLNGNVSSPTWQVSSSIDKLLKNAVSGQVNEKLTALKSEYQSGLNAKVSDMLKLNEGSEAEFVQLESLLTDSDNALDQLLKSDVVKQKEKELKNKAKDKLKDKLGSFFK